MNRRALITLLAAMVSFPSFGGRLVPPPNGYVPDANTAIKIAVAVWEPIYGAQRVAGERPYRATLKDGIWVVEGAFKNGSDGGGVTAKIKQTDGQILEVFHGP